MPSICIPSSLVPSSSSLPRLGGGRGIATVTTIVVDMSNSCKTENQLQSEVPTARGLENMCPRDRRPVEGPSTPLMTDIVPRPVQSSIVDDGGDASLHRVLVSELISVACFCLRGGGCLSVANRAGASTGHSLMYTVWAKASNICSHVHEVMMNDVYIFPLMQNQGIYG